MERIKNSALFIILLVALCLGSAGCVSAPFKKIRYINLEEIDPAVVRVQFAQALAPEMDLVSSIVFQYKWQSFAALGYSRLDLVNGTFQVSCMSPVGVKLFELTGNRQEIKPVFVLKELLQKGDLPRAVGEDIRRIYFDLVPGPGAQVKKQKYKIVYTQDLEKGKAKYVFAGRRLLLTEKHYREKKRLLWSVYYYDYAEQNGKLYPAKILLKHHRFGYNLVIRLKEVR